MDQNLLYIVIAVVVIIVILLAVLLRRRGSGSGPSNINQYLGSEAELKKIQIVEYREGFKTKIPMYMRKPEDDLNDIRAVTSKLEHKNTYYDPKVEDKLEQVEHQKTTLNLKKQIDTIKRKDLELNRLIKPKKDK